MENFRLKVFRSVAVELSFRKAAEVLHLSQPAVSQQIRALEEEAGVRLFDRQASGIALTEAGRILLTHATSAALTVQQAQRELAALNHEVAGDLHLGASTTIAQYVLPRILGAFLRQYPHVHLSLIGGNTERIVEAVAEERIPLGIIEGPAMRRGLKTERMMQDEMVLIASPDHPLSFRKQAVPPTALMPLPLLMRERGSGSRRVVERALQQAGLPLRSLRIAFELDSTEAIVSGVEAGLGVGFVSRFAIGKALRLSTLRTIAVEGLEIRRDFSFIRLPGSDLEGAPAAFRRFALAALAETQSPL
jgi:DNA-binding transcriptional LysR family regulator